MVGQVAVLDPDKGQNHFCTVHDLIVDAASSSEQLVSSRHFTVDNSLNLKTLNGLNFEAQHSIDIGINCSDGSLAKTELFSITVRGKLPVNHMHRRIYSFIVLDSFNFLELFTLSQNYSITGRLSRTCKLLFYTVSQLWSQLVSYGDMYIVLTVMLTVILTFESVNQILW